MSIFPITKSAANEMHEPGIPFRRRNESAGLKELDLKELDSKALKTWIVCVMTADDRSFVCVISTKFRKKCDLTAAQAGQPR
jgi:hypothetical protein